MKLVGAQPVLFLSCVEVCVKNLIDDHGVSSVIQHCSNEEHQVGVTHLCHGANLTVDTVHSSRLKDAGIHSLDSNHLTLQYVTMRSL